MVKITFCLLALILLFGTMNSCTDTILTPKNEFDIWPLEVGNIWKYKIVAPDYINDTIIYSIDGTIDVQYQGSWYRVYKLSVYAQDQGPHNYQWLYWKGDDGIYFMGGVSDTDTMIVKELALKFPVTVGDSWKYQSVNYSFDDNKFLKGDTLTYELVSDSVVITSNNTAYTCHQYRFRQKPSEDILLYSYIDLFVSEGVGIVEYRNSQERSNKIQKQQTLISFSLK